MKLKAKGYGRHRFWGEYSMHLVLRFDSRDAALMAKLVLNDMELGFGEFYNAGGGWTKSSGWHEIAGGQGEASRALLLEVGGPWLDATLRKLEEHGADRKKMTSMAKSVDYCEDFDVEIEVEDPNQLPLL